MPKGLPAAQVAVTTRLENLDLNRLLIEVGRDYLLTPSEEEGLRTSSIRLRNELRGGK